ncbi:MAG: CU044_2847 family protein [Methylocella sp.]
MPARMVVDLSDGNILLFGGFPVQDAPDAGVSDGFTRATSETFKAALSSIGDLVKTLEASIEAMPKRPEKIEIEFGATLAANATCGLSRRMTLPSSRSGLPGAKGINSRGAFDEAPRDRRIARLTLANADNANIPGQTTREAGDASLWKHLSRALSRDDFLHGRENAVAGGLHFDLALVHRPEA